MWFLWLNGRKSAFYPATAQDCFTVWIIVYLLWHHRYMKQPPAIVTSQWPIVPVCALWMLSHHNGVEVSDLSRYVPSFSRFIIERICGAANCLASDAIINWPRATHTARIMALIILQWRDSIRIIHSGRPRNLCTFSFNVFAYFPFLFSDARVSTRGNASRE